MSSFSVSYSGVVLCLCFVYTNRRGENNTNSAFFLANDGTAIILWSWYVLGYFVHVIPHQRETSAQENASGERDENKTKRGTCLAGVGAGEGRGAGEG